MDLRRTQKKPVIAHWSKLPRWDYKSARAALFAQLHPDFVPLGEYAEEATELVDPRSAPDKEWPIYGVSNDSGVFLNKLQKGTEFNSNYKRIRKDYFFHNPTRANVGSLGRVHDVPPDAVTSPEYQIWKLRPELLPEFAEILIKTDFFLDQIECHRVGGVKERLFVQNLFEIPVPIPSLSIQQKIVDYLASTQKSIAIANEGVAQIENKIQKSFLTDLGLPECESFNAPKLFSASWKDFERWSVSYNKANMSMLDLTHGKYPVVELGSVFEMLQYGTSEKANTSESGTPVLRMNNIKNGRLDYSRLKHVILPQKTLSSLLLVDGDILFNRTNSKDLVGKCAVFYGSEEYVFASYLIRVRPKANTAISDFVAYCINSIIGRQQIDALSRQIIGQANINSQELRSLRIPLPPLDVQIEIMKHINAGRSEILQQSEIINRLHSQTRSEIEKMILGTRPVGAH